MNLYSKSNGPCPACELNELPENDVMCSECREYYERQKVAIVLGDVFDKYEDVSGF